MRIEKIELIGFKSFAEKTTFHLHPGITCIVGPNGVGKSNVVDSFRWVLGEQSAKSLRGEKMEEVIFSGSATKKPRGMSEVNLLISFDSPEGGNGDSQNLTSVSRRLYRSGESEYMLNRDQCRLKDIRDLFLDTGLEIKSYSILEQGKIGEIINSRPQDRRFLIEEVAGVMKYKVRRAEALSKLESSRLNLQRINDIVSEVKRQINSLDRQVKKAERYKKLSGEMRAIELKIARRDYTNLQESLNNILSEYRSLNDEETIVRAGISKAENIIEAGRIGLLEKEKSLDSLMSDLQGLEREIAETERLIAISTTESASLKEYIVKIKDQESDLVQKVSSAGQRKNELDSLEKSLSEEIDALRHELHEGNESIKAIEDELSRKEELIESKRRDVFRIAEEMSHIRNEITRILTSIENLERKHSSISKESEAARTHISEIEAGLRDTDSTLIDYNNRLLFLNEEKSKLAADIDEQMSKLDLARDNLSRLREELASASSRLDSLREIMREDFSQDAFADNLRIVASVAEIIEVDEIYEKAIEGALSEKVKGFILSSHEDISHAASTMKDRGINRTVFIPLNLFSEKMNEPRGTNNLPPAGSLIGWAADIVRVRSGNESFLPIVRGLLNNVCVVKDLSSAFPLVRDYRLTLVTMDGEIVEPSGAVTIGEGRGILKRQRDIRDLEVLITQRNNDIERHERALRDSDELLQDKKVSLKGIESAIIDTERESSLLRLKAENQKNEQEKISRKMSFISIEAEEILKEKESFKNMAGVKEAEIEKLSIRRNEDEEAISQMQDAISKNRERYEIERARITELKVSLNSCKERIESVRNERETLQKMLSELSNTRERLIEDKAGIDLRIAQCKDDIERNNEAQKGLVLNANNLRTVISDSKEIIRNESEDMRLSEQEIKAFRSKLDSLTSRVSELDVLIAEHRLRIENLSDGIRLNYGIEIDSLEAEQVIPEDEERLAEIRARIQELGPVNQGILDEYEELRTRHEFLTKQQGDLNKSIAELEEAITKINSTTRKRLRDAFEQLNEKFSEVFTLLFGGGKAGLVMTDENNILDTGIDIIAQPPGKKLQNIHLLSGGEKALTALSLLFATFLIKPSPLCVLDEVDAPLDDANIERFARMLRELSSKIQFIVITHNRVTMEAADYIYGITTEEPGVSKVISMKLTDSEEVAV